MKFITKKTKPTKQIFLNRSTLPGQEEIKEEDRKKKVHVNTVVIGMRAEK